MIGLDMCAPEGVVEIPMFAPRIFKNPDPGNRYWLWLVECELPGDACRGHGDRRKDLAPILTDPRRRALWVKFAAECAERIGLLVPAPSTVVSACERQDLEPTDRALDARAWGGAASDWWCCGLPIRAPGSAAALTKVRLGWSDARIAEARRPSSVRTYQGDRDYDVWLPCWTRCREDLLAGAVTAEELAALGATEQNAGYLRLSESARTFLGQRVYPPTSKRESAALQDPYYQTCWAYTAGGMQ
jgi:hypothetical protein